MLQFSKKLSYILPTFRVVSIVMVSLLISLAVNGYSEPGSSAKHPYRTEPLFTVGVYSGYRMPTGFFSKLVGNYPIVGFSVSLPGRSPHYWIHAEFDGGHMPFGISNHMLIFRQSLSLLYTFDISQSVSLGIQSGLSNTMIYPDKRLQISAHPFAPSESEFGFSTGLTPSYSIRSYSIQLPILFDIALSSPRAFPYLTTGIGLTKAF